MSIESKAPQAGPSVAGSGSGMTRRSLGRLALAGAGVLTSSRPAAGQSLSGEIAVAMTPANFPQHKAKDVEDMFTLGKDVATGAILIYQWGEQDFQKVAKTMVGLCNKANLTPILSISPTKLEGARNELDVPNSVRKAAKRDLSFKNGAVNKQFAADVLELAKLNPAYLGLATEINLLAFKDIKEYIYFAAVCKKLYPEIKKISPNTKVFVSFQWDFFHIMAKREPNKIKEHAKLIDIFRPELDVIALTSYPADHFGSPNEIPSDYYSKIYNYVGKSDRVMLTEIGWPSTGKGNERSQEQFILRLPELTNSMKPLYVGWSLLHDVRVSSFGESLGTTGILMNNGKPKPGFAALKKVRR